MRVAFNKYIYRVLIVKISKEIKNLTQVIAILLVIATYMYISSTAIMSMGDFSGNGR
jgi:hypothetical protein